jgi:hypothetical protein
MQNVSFRNLNDFLDFLPEDEREIAEVLRQIVFDCIPMAKEKLSYNVPYYKVHKNICFIWPASVFWGNSKSYEGVRFGFTKGYLLQDENGFLDKGTRKQVYWKDFTTCDSINIPLLKSFIFDALRLDEQVHQENKHKVRK